MAGPNVLNVYLLGVADPAGRWAVVDDPTGDEGEAPPRVRGFLGRVEARLRTFREGVSRSDGRAARAARRAWEWLQSRTHPDEPLLARLRSARSVEVRHPSAVTPDEAARAWSRLLADGRRRHRGGFLGHALVAPLSVALAPLPGPNLLGYWFVYRAARHWLILVGLGRVRRGLIVVSFRPDDADGGAVAA